MRASKRGCSVKVMLCILRIERNGTARPPKSPRNLGTLVVAAQRFCPMDRARSVYCHGLVAGHSPRAVMRLLIFGSVGWTSSHTTLRRLHALPGNGDTLSWL